ncbi:hypothetical protein [Leptolyngbya ohadii]|uniref:hypothetical protein n=1 Tax=Leptolyngbya ohadii TaxID=1962290 RepID=UPI00117B5F5D|nr:hypothetical protein [Leptolyngbya ohadii]
MSKPINNSKSIRLPLPKSAEASQPLNHPAQQASESTALPDHSPDSPSVKPSSGVLSLEAAIDFSQAAGNRQNANPSD